MSTRRSIHSITFVEPRGTAYAFCAATPLQQGGCARTATAAKLLGADAYALSEDILVPQITSGMVFRHLRSVDAVVIYANATGSVRAREWMRVLEDWRNEKGDDSAPLVLVVGPHVKAMPQEFVGLGAVLVKHEDALAALNVLEVAEAQKLETRAARYDALLAAAAAQERDGTEVPPPWKQIPPDYHLLWEGRQRGATYVVETCSDEFARGLSPFPVEAGQVTARSSVTDVLERIDYHWSYFRPKLVVLRESAIDADLDRLKAILRGLAAVEKRKRPRIGLFLDGHALRDPETVSLMHQARVRQVELQFFRDANSTGEFRDAAGNTPKEARKALRRTRVSGHAIFHGVAETDTAATPRLAARVARSCGFDTFDYRLPAPWPGSSQWAARGLSLMSTNVVTHDWSRYTGRFAVLAAPKCESAYAWNKAAWDGISDFYTLLRPSTLGQMARFKPRKRTASASREAFWEWMRTATNSTYLSDLYQRMTQPAAEAAAPIMKRIVIAHTQASLVLREQMDQIIERIGVKVEHSRAGIEGFLEQGRTQLASVSTVLQNAYQERVGGQPTIIVVPTTGDAPEVTIEKSDMSKLNALVVSINVETAAWKQQLTQILENLKAEWNEAAMAMQPHALKAGDAPSA